jgi:hypothetical protein
MQDIFKMFNNTINGVEGFSISVLVETVFTRDLPAESKVATGR